jgi:hypothetical protein
VGLKSSQVWGCPCPLGYNEFDFFEENKTTDPVMGAKLNSETYLQNPFFFFFDKFRAHLVSNLQ